MPQVDQCAYEQDPCAPSVDSKPLRLRKRVHQANAPVRISEADEARLTLYLGELGTRFERSVSGRILEIQEQFGSLSTRCRRCKGAGIIDGPDGFAVVLQEVQRTRQSSTQRRSIEAIPDESVRWEAVEQQATVGGWCRPCNGTGSVPRAESGPQRCTRCEGRGRLNQFNVRPGQNDLPCDYCLSTGYARLTAEPTGSSIEGSDNAPSEGALTLYAITSRQLDAVRARSEVCALSIITLFGDQGARWARTAHGRMFSLYQYTAAGKRLAKWAEARAISEKEHQIATANGKKKAAKKGPTHTWVNPAPLGNVDPFTGAPCDDAEQSKRWARRQAQWVRRMFRSKHLREFIGPIQQSATRNTWLSSDQVPAAGRSAVRPDIELTIQERIGSEANIERVRPDPYRRKLLLEAAEQARQLYVRASKLWVIVGALIGRPSKRQAEQEQEEREAVVRLHDRFRSKGLVSAATYIATQVKSR